MSVFHVGDENLNFILRNCAIDLHWDAEQPLFTAAKIRNVIKIQGYCKRNRYFQCCIETKLLMI